MSDTLKILSVDLYRFNKKKGLWNIIWTAVRKPGFRHICYLRWFSNSKLHLLSRLLLRNSTNRTGLDLNTTIGPGLVIHHPFNIAINGRTIIGVNCTLYQGCVIGMEFRGERAGTPTLGNNVWVGSNAVIVGNIHIGNDVLIAPLSYVNFDVPDHSIVIGNPGRIIPRGNATEKYIVNTTDLLS